MCAKSVHLSPAAAADLGDIMRYAIGRWGNEQWRVHLAELDAVLEQLGDNPALGRARDEVRPGLRSFPVESHVIWYRDGPEAVEIVRVLHGMMDYASEL